MNVRELAQEYYPRLWDIDRLKALVTVDKLSEADYKEITGESYEAQTEATVIDIVETIEKYWVQKILAGISGALVWLGRKVYYWKQGQDLVKQGVLAILYDRYLLYTPLSP